MSEVNNKYMEPVNRLLVHGEIEAFGEWENYLRLGLTEEHVPDLIRMATDETLHEAYSDTAEVWAPIHAWRALGQLRAEQAI